MRGGGGGGKGGEEGWERGGWESEDEGENREREGEEEGGRWWPWEVEASLKLTFTAPWRRMGSRPCATEA